jgi:hypothetical protein
VFKNSNSNVTKQLDNKGLTTKLSFGLFPISKIRHLYPSAPGISDVMKHGRTPVLTVGFLQRSWSIFEENCYACGSQNSLKPLMLSHLHAI